MEHDASKIRVAFWILTKRFLSVRKYILIPAIASFVSIILIEFWFKHIPGKSVIDFDFGQVYLKLCYSFVSAFVFYFLVVHYPKERRKVRVFRFISNKTFELSSEIDGMFSTISKISKMNIALDKISLNVIISACVNMNPNDPIEAKFGSINKFENWWQYLIFKSDRVKNIIDRLIILNDSIDEDYLELLTFIEDDFSKLLKHARSIEYVKSLNTSTHNLFEIAKNKTELMEIMQKKYKKYEDEFHYYARIRNVKGWGGVVPKVK